MTRTSLFCVLIAIGILAAAPAVAQTAAGPAPDGRYGPAPWWMRDPIIASTGLVEMQTPANRAGFSAAFQTIDREATTATVNASAKVRALGAQLAALGADKVQVQVSFTTTPLYEQYRDRAGNMQDNERADKIERYQVTANVAVTVRDVALLEKVYSMVLAAGPTSVSQVGFSLEPDNAMRADLSRRAIEDAAARARSAVEAAGARLGPVKLIDPTARACEADVLVAGAPRGVGGGGYAVNGEVSDVVITSYSRAPVAAPPPPPTPEQMQVPLQPPLMTLRARACVIFGLG